MRAIKILLSSAVTLSLVLFLNRSWNFGSPIPPLGKFLDPFHGFWQNAESGKRPPVQFELKGLREEVTVIYDSLMIPHIFAKNDEDLYFAQGYITARDRLWQMEFTTVAAAGRISEIIGKAALDYDRTQRRLGMGYAATRSLEMMEANPVAKKMFDSYGKGVNSLIQSLPYADLPIEYKLLDYEPEPWTNLKIALLQATLAKTLNDSEKDFEMTNALRLFGKGMVDLLYPDNEQSGDPIVDAPNTWTFKPVLLDSIPSALPPELLHIRGLEKSSPGNGSNNWAVSGSKTSTGAPLLCNDPHLDLKLPSIWYVVHLQAPGVNVMGASLPGGPAVVIGFNDSIAWGETNAQRDLVDWYKITFKDKRRNEYLSDGRWKPARKVVETFTIRNSDPYHDTVTYTHHGPVVYDESFHNTNEKSHFAYRWLSHDPSIEALALYYINRSMNYKDFEESLRHWDAPAQNFVFASRRGDIAIRIQGKFPVRRKDEGKFVLDGTRTSTEWKAFIPPEQSIESVNPSRGFVSSANQYPADKTYPYYINGRSYEAYRNRRINQVLAQTNKLTPQDMMKLQLDTYNLRAAESVPFLLSQLDSSSLSGPSLSAYRSLTAWEFNSAIESEASSYYEAWWNALVAMTWDEMDSDTIELARPTYFTTIKLLKENPKLPLFDIAATPEKETARDVIRKSFAVGVETIEQWKEKHKASSVPWADFKDTFIGHLLRGLPAFSFHVRHGGTGSTVDASTHTHGPSWRMVVSLEKEGIKAWGVYPGGQSGNPGSPYYNSLLNSWADGKYFALHFPALAEQLSRASLSTVSLKPSKP